MGDSSEAHTIPHHDQVDGSEGHKDMKMEPPNNRNPPERCPRPRDSRPEDLTVPHHGQNGTLGDYRIIIKEEYKEEDEEYGVMKELADGHRDLYKEPPERCPRPLYPRDPTQEHHEIPQTRPLYPRDPTQEDLTIPRHDQGGEVIAVKVEAEEEEEEEEEETYVRDDRQCTEEVEVMRIFIEEDGMIRTIKEEDTPTEISTGPAIKNLSPDHLSSSPSCKPEDQDFSSDFGGLHGVDGPWNPPEAEQPPPVRDGAGIQGKKTFPGPGFKRYTGEKLHPCPDCGKRFATKSLVVRHQRTHTGEKPYSCSECGKSYSQTSQLLRHQRMHTGDKPHSCPECGKGFPVKYELIAHQRSHLPDKPYSCPECGKSYPRKLHLARHQRSHTGLKPYFCSECGKCFKEKSHLHTHLKTHTSEKPYGCTECGKCFKEKYHLNSHWKIHKGEKSFACPDCGKGFLTQAHLNRHQKMHTGEKPYFCPECGKSFTRKSHVSRHQRSHTTPEEQ